MKIFSKLFLLLAVLSALPLAIAAVVLMRQSGSLQHELMAKSTETGERTSRQSETALERQASKSHRQVVAEKAEQIRGFFENIRRAVLLESTLIVHGLATQAPPEGPPLYPAEEIYQRLQNDKQWAKNAHGKEPYTGYHLAPGVKPERVQENMQRLRQLGYFFAHNQRALPWCISTYMGHRDGFIFGYPGRSAYPKLYDPRKRPWYLEAAKQGHLVWTDLYLDRNRIDMVITCANPVYWPLKGKSKQLVAVAAIDVKLTQIVEQIFRLPGLEVSDAMLTEGAQPTDRVIISKAYEKNKKDFGDQTKTANLTRIAALRDAQFRQAFAEIRRRSKVGERVGIVQIKGTGKETGKAATSDALFTYATVIIREQSYDKKKGRLKSWFYVVKTPVDNIIEPVKGIRRAHRASQKELSGEIKGQVESLWIQIVAISVIVLLLAMAAAYVVARSSTRPLIYMCKVAEKIGKGDLDQHVDVKTKDEVGQLGLAINEMVDGLKDRDFIRATIKNYVAGSVVDDLLEHPEKLQLGGERKVLTVLFSDLEGFTTLSERLNPAELIELINEYFGEMTTAIVEHQGTIDKYLGDAIMAFWGAPVDQEDHALNACKTALDNIARLRQLWVEWEERGLPRIDMRIGINTGPMIVGNAGSPQLKNYTVMGDAVNLGSRLEGVNKLYGTRILISGATRDACGDAIVVRELDLIAVKGKSEAVRIFELIGLAGEVKASELEAIATFEAGLVAYRALDWDAAQDLFIKVQAARGEDGPSKTYLLRIELFREEPPPDNWDGTFTALVK